MVNNLSPILDGISCHADEMGLTIHPPLPLPDYTGCYHNTYTEGLLTLGRDYRFFSRIKSIISAQSPTLSFLNIHSSFIQPLNIPSVPAIFQMVNDEGGLSRHQ